MWSRPDFVALSDHLGTAHYTYTVYSVVCQVSFWSSWIICGWEYFLQFNTASQETRQPCVNVVNACRAGRTLEHCKESIWKRSRVSSKDDLTFPSPLKTFCLTSLWYCMMCIKVGVFLFLCTSEWLVTVIMECIYDSACTCVNMFDVFE